MFFRFRPLFLLSLLYLFLVSGCGSSVPIVDENLILTPVSVFPTSTPFQPLTDTSQDTLYSAPVATVTLLPSAVTPGSVNIEQSLLPTPHPLGYQGMPIFAVSSNTNPLTGLTVTDPELMERRPLAIKITQFPRYTRPQSGLSLADVVYEYYIEDGVSRFIAVFYGNNSELVGPVRSGRFFDEHVARMYQAFLVFKYADPRVYNHLKSTDLNPYLVVPGIGACPPFVIGDSKRDTYNNIFLNTNKFNDCIAKREEATNTRPPLTSSFFSYLRPASIIYADRIYTKYSLDDYNYWQYLPSKGRYQRYQEVESMRNGDPPTYAPLTDAVTELPIMADNVVVLFVYHRFEDFYQMEDEVFHIDLVDSGDAYLFRDGLVVEASWHRPQVDQPIILTTRQGAPVYLKPGVTFYQVIGLTSEVGYSANEWYFAWHHP